jgi:DNA-binding NarL/FixJ family response regulator
MIKTALVDDHQLFRKSLSYIIDCMEGIEVIYDSGDGNDFIDFVKKIPVDLVLLDIQMPIISGFEVCRKLREQNIDIKILIISQLTSKESIHHVMECGANGFFTKNSTPAQLETAIRKVVNEGFYFDAGLVTTLREVILWDKKSHFNFNLNQNIHFTEREIDIIRLICKEKNSAEISAALEISCRTVETHRNRILKKMNVKNFIGVVLYALKSELIFLEDI